MRGKSKMRTFLPAHENPSLGLRLVYVDAVMLSEKSRAMSETPSFTGK